MNGENGGARGGRVDHDQALAWRKDAPEKMETGRKAKHVESGLQRIRK